VSKPLEGVEAEGAGKRASVLDRATATGASHIFRCGSANVPSERQSGRSDLQRELVFMPHSGRLGPDQI
jgi:hypothetical protein